MSSAYTPILVGVASSVLEMWLPFKNGHIVAIIAPARFSLQVDVLLWLLLTFILQ